MNIGWSAHLNSHNKKCGVEYFIHNNILGAINYFDNESNFYYCIIKTNSFEFNNIIISKDYFSLIYDITPIIDDKEAYDFLIKAINKHKDNLIFE